MNIKSILTLILFQLNCSKFSGVLLSITTHLISIFKTWPKQRKEYNSKFSVLTKPRDKNDNLRFLCMEKQS